MYFYYKSDLHTEQKLRVYHDRIIYILKQVVGGEHRQRYGLMCKQAHSHTLLLITQLIHTHT